MLDIRACLFVLLALAVGPIGTVNLLLKDQWGRPRPAQIVEFGGAKAFQPVWVRSQQCDRNCSFVSGDVAAATWLLAPASLLRGRQRRYAYRAVLALIAAIAAARLLVGAHFLSDVILAAMITHLTTWVSHRLVYGGQPVAARLHQLKARLAALWLGVVGRIAIARRTWWQAAMRLDGLGRRLPALKTTIESRRS